MPRVVKPWSTREESHLLLQWMIQPDGLCARFAKAHRRTQRGVRMKLHHLLNDPERVPVSFKAAIEKYRAAQRDRNSAQSRDRNAAAPQVPTACGPGGTSCSRT